MGFHPGLFRLLALLFRPARGLARILALVKIGDPRLPQRNREGVFRRTVLGDSRDVPTHESRSAHLRARRGCRRQHERGARAVVLGDAGEASHEHGNVRPKHAAVDVALVDDDVSQRSKERDPVFVTGKDPVMQHVGVREHNIRVAAHPATLFGRGVAVEYGGAYVPEAGPVHKTADRRVLVVGKRFCGCDVEGARAPGRRILAARLNIGQRGQEIAERLSRSGRGGDDRVATCVREFGGLDLVPPRAFDPAVFEVGA